MKLIKKFLLLYIAIITSCGTKQETQDSRSMKVDQYDVDIGEKLDSEDWNCEPTQEDNICYPRDWKPVDQTKFTFFSYLNNDDDNTFFVVAKYDLVELGMTDKDYLKEVYRQLKTDTVEIFEEYSFKELIYENRNSSYYGEFSTQVQSKNYFTYTMYTVKGGSLFDITLKVEKRYKDNYYKQFQNILYNIKTDNIYLFDFKEEIKEVKSVNLEGF